MSWKKLILLTSGSLFFFCSVAIAGDVWVDANYTGRTQVGSFKHPFRTIAAGLNAAVSGDKVRCKSGTYSPSSNGETLPITMKAGVSVLGESLPSMPIIDGTGIYNPNANYDIRFDGIGGSALTALSRFVIRDLGNSSYSTRAAIMLMNCSNTNIVIEGNVLDIHGGPSHIYGIDVYNSAAIVRNNIIYGYNNADGCVVVDAGATVTAANNTISNCYGSVIIWAFAGQTHIVDTIIASASLGWGIYNQASCALLDTRNNSFYNNWSNRGEGIQGAVICPADPSEIYGLNPLFVNPPLDFHLQVGSPCIDTGANTSGYGVQTDFDGNPRPIGAGFDIGAYER